MVQRIPLCVKWDWVVSSGRGTLDRRGVLAAIHLNQSVGRSGTGNQILSVYDKGAPAVQQWMKDGLLRYAHQKKARAYFQSARLQLPREGSKGGIGNHSLNPRLSMIPSSLIPSPRWWMRTTNR